MKELAALAYRDTTDENRKFWKSEMSQALREIQDTYDEKLESMRGDVESFYNFKVGILQYIIQYNTFVMNTRNLSPLQRHSTIVTILFRFSAAAFMINNS